MRDIDYLFLFITLFNTGIGLNNIESNKKEKSNQEELQNKIDEMGDKINRILEVIDKK